MHDNSIIMLSSNVPSIYGLRCEVNKKISIHTDMKIEIVV